MDTSEQGTLAAFVLLVGLALNGCAAQEQAQSPDPLFVARADAVAAQFQKALQAELSAAMAQGGPMAAIGVCQSAAPAIAQKLSDDSGLHLSRIAERNRNPDGTVPSELADLYTELKREPVKGGMPHVINAIVNERTVSLRAIPMKDEPCSVCHGTAVKAEVNQAIESIYPGDKATGFNAGELRGAMLVMDRPF